MFIYVKQKWEMKKVKIYAIVNKENTNQAFFSRNQYLKIKIAQHLKVLFEL